jgi:high-affinity nickel-transport protein
MPSWFISASFLAGLFGVRHALDADHLAAIDGLSRAYMTAGRPLLARRCGVLFSVGHGLVVMAAGLALQGRDHLIPAWLEGAGNLLSIALLFLLGSMNLIQALRRQGKPVSNPMAAALLRAGFTRGFAGALMTGVLFALSFDTFTLAAWFGTAGLTGGAGGTGAVLFLAASFVVAMILCDGLNGLWVAHLICQSRGFAEPARRLFSALVAVIALTIAAIEVVRLHWEAIDAWFATRGLSVSVAILAALLLGFYAASPGRRPVSHRARELRE